MYHEVLVQKWKKMNKLKKIVLPTDVPEQGLLCALLWSDPDPVERAKEGFLEKMIEEFLLYLMETLLRYYLKIMI